MVPVPKPPVLAGIEDLTAKEGLALDLPIPVESVEELVAVRRIGADLSGPTGLPPSKEPAVGFVPSVMPLLLNVLASVVCAPGYQSTWRSVAPALVSGCPAADAARSTLAVRGLGPAAPGVADAAIAAPAVPPAGTVRSPEEGDSANPRFAAGGRL